MTISAIAQRRVLGKGGELGYDDGWDSGWGGLILLFIIVGGISYSLNNYWEKQDSSNAEKRKTKEYKRNLKDH